MSQTLLSVADLCVDFTQGGKSAPVVRGVSFDVAAGETLALVGESGSGKTLSALSVMRLLPSAARQRSGRILFQGRDLTQASDLELRRLRGDRLAMIFQEPLSALNPLLTIGAQMTEILTWHSGMSRAQARARAAELLLRVGIEDASRIASAYAHQLSGGQRQRAMIAMMLANRPDLLIADEPTTALDVTVQTQILALLKDLRAELGMAMLLITHDLGVVRSMADRVCVMTNGEIVEHGIVREVFERPQHDYTRRLLAAVPAADAQPVDAAAPELLKVTSLKLRFPVRKGVLRRVVGHVAAVDDVSFSLGRGQTLAVVGESGSGKTSLGLALLRLMPSCGEIRFDGLSLERLTSRQMRPLRKDMQVVFQDPFASLNPRHSVASAVLEGLDVHGAAPRDAAARRACVAQALAEVGLPSEAQDRYPHEFSGGQRQRIAIARALALKPRFIMLDEPTSSLDMTAQAQIVDLLRALQARHQLTYLFISHDLKVVRAMANTLLVMKAGRVVEGGHAADIFERPREAYTRELLAAAFQLEGRATPL
jgi:microcin C transport system ATP-binding protein